MTHSYLSARRVAAGHSKNKFSIMEKAFGLANASVYDYGVLYPDGNRVEMRQTNIHGAPFFGVVNIDGLLKHHGSDGFVKRSRARLAKPGERGVLKVRRNDEGYA